MNELGIHTQRLIKKQRFNLNTMDGQSRWRTGRVNLDYRITWVTDEYWNTKVNIMVKGKIEDKKMYTEGDPQNGSSYRSGSLSIYKRLGKII